MISTVYAWLLVVLLSGTGVDQQWIEIENKEGAVIQAEIVSVLRVEKGGPWLCFRKPEDSRLYLYPFTSLSASSLQRLSVVHSGPGGFLVVDGLTGPQLDVLEEYLAAEPRERLLIELRQCRKNERLLDREWQRLQSQTWELQQKLAGAQTPEQRALIGPLFQQSLHARDRTGKELALLRRKIARLEERIQLLRRIGVDIEDNPFGEP